MTLGLASCAFRAWIFEKWCPHILSVLVCLLHCFVCMYITRDFSTCRNLAAESFSFHEVQPLILATMRKTGSCEVDPSFSRNVFLPSSSSKPTYSFHLSSSSNSTFNTLTMFDK